MTNILKAIKFAKSEIKSLELAPKINGCEITEWRKEKIEIWKTAISALEKQIPKKPLHWDDCEQFYIECPCCGKRYDSRLGYKGCPYCLQAIRLE